MAGSDDLTEAERYRLWGEHIRLLFTAPVQREEERGRTLYDRDVSDLVSYYNTNNKFMHTGSEEEAGEVAAHSTSSSSSSNNSVPSSSFYDEASYPYCFYRRMLQHTELTHEGTTAAAKDTTLGYKEDDHSYHDEQQAVERLAARLRRRAAATAKARTARQDLAAGNDAFTLAFCDPKVEAVQAALHAEMTELLLDIRRHNRLVAEATSRLHFSRLVLLREPTHEPA